jgi:hypothetical protein
MKISSDELFVANKKIKKGVRKFKGSQWKFSRYSKFNEFKCSAAVENNFNPIEYLKGQALEIVSIKQREELLQSLAVQNEELNEYAHVVSHDLSATS